MPFKVTVDGKEHEVEQDAIQAPDGTQILSTTELSDGYVTKAAHKGQMDKLRTSTATEVNKAKEGRFTPEELLADDNQTALQTFVETGREKLSGMLNVKISDEQRKSMLEQLQKNWETQILGPVNEKLEASEGRAGKLLRKALVGTVSAASGRDQAGVRAGLVDFLVDRYEKLAAYDDEEGDFFVLEPDGKSFKPNTNSGDGQPTFLPIVEDLKNRRASGEWGDVFDPKARDGTGIGDAANRKGGTPDGLDHIKKKSDAKNKGEKVAFIKKRHLAAWEALPA